MKKQEASSLTSPARRRFHIACAATLFLAACGSRERYPDDSRFAEPEERMPPTGKGRDIVLYALGFLDINYRFGGKSPQTGFDCSGLVSYVYARAAGINIIGNAADIAEQGTPIPRDALRPGDLVFFNTLNRPFSHVGIYIGDNQFIHAPATNKKVRINNLDERYYAERFQEARAYFN